VVLFREDFQDSLASWFGQVVSEAAARGRREHRRTPFSAAQSAAVDVAEEFGVVQRMPNMIVFKVTNKTVPKVTFFKNILFYRMEFLLFMKEILAAI